MILEQQTWASRTETLRLEKNDHGAGDFLRVRGSTQAQSALLEKIVAVSGASCEWGHAPRVSMTSRQVMVLTIRRVSGRLPGAQLIDLVAKNLCDLGFSRTA